MARKENKLVIRSSAAEFLIFTNQAAEDAIEVRYEDDTVWLSQKMLMNLYEVSKATISEHLKNIFETGELDEVSTVRKFRTVQKEGTRQVTREIERYNLDAILAKDHAVSEFEKYRIVQDRLFQSDFDQEMQKIEQESDL
ncbi:MAG: hypothetical protein KGO93_02830 [Cyanobacteria bacterium REEB446]|nr:hypothetical protein [Cyanobacteria bacterium REEB446]